MVRGSLLAMALAACTPGGPPKPPPLHLQSTIAARWDGGSITADEVRAAAQRLPTALREQFQTESGQREFVQAVLAKRLLHAEAQRRGLTEAPEVREQVRELEERLAIQALLEQASRARGGPTDDELKRYFESHRSEFRTPARVRITRLLFRGSHDDKALKARVQAMRGRVQSKREPLSKLVPLGDGPEVANGGDVGWISEANDAESAAALGLKADEVSPVVETPSGFAVLIATQREEPRDATFEEVRQAIVTRYAPVQQRKVFDELVQQLKTQAQVQVNPAAFR